MSFLIIIVTFLKFNCKDIHFLNYFLRIVFRNMDRRYILR